MTKMPAMRIITARGKGVQEAVPEEDVAVDVVVVEGILEGTPALIQSPATIDSTAGKTTENFLQQIESTFAL